MKKRILLAAFRKGHQRRSLLFCALISISAISFGLSESTGPGGSNVQAVHALGYEGQNINIGFISADNLLESHEAFYEKDTNGLPTGPQHAFVHDTLLYGITPTNHDTELAGIIVSNGGQSYPDQIGVAPKAYLHNIKIVSGGNISMVTLPDALTELITVYNCKVIVTGIALAIDGNGQSTWSKIYDYYAETYDVLFANAAGNYNSSYPDLTTVNVFGDAYNGITTAGLINTGSTDIYDKIGTLSLPGPTTDGRNKPDVSGPSPYQTVPYTASDTSWTTVVGTTQGYTSWSVPHTAGVAALLLDYADGSGDADREHSEVIKAVIVNSTFPNIQDEYGTATTGEVWNNYRGYGRLDALRAFETLSAPRVNANSSTPQEKGWAFESIRRNQTHTYTITGHKNQRLVATVTWHRKLTASLTEESPRFYVDLEVVSLSSGSTVISQPAGVDNLTKIDVLLDENGQYQIIINNAPQFPTSRDYAMAFELIDPLAADFNVDYVVDTQDVADLASYWLDTNCYNTGAACYDYDLSPNGQIDLGDFAVVGENWLAYDSRYYTPN